MVINQSTGCIKEIYLMMTKWKVSGSFYYLSSGNHECHIQNKKCTVHPSDTLLWNKEAKLFCLHTVFVLNCGWICWVISHRLSLCIQHDYQMPLPHLARFWLLRLVTSDNLWDYLWDYLSLAMCVGIHWNGNGLVIIKTIRYINLTWWWQLRW